MLLASAAWGSDLGLGRALGGLASGGVSRIALGAAGCGLLLAVAALTLDLAGIGRPRTVDIAGSSGRTSIEVPGLEGTLAEVILEDRSATAAEVRLVVPRRGGRPMRCRAAVVVPAVPDVPGKAAEFSARLRERMIEILRPPVEPEITVEVSVGPPRGRPGSAPESVPSGGATLEESGRLPESHDFTGERDYGGS